MRSRTIARVSTIVLVATIALVAMVRPTAQRAGGSASIPVISENVAPIEPMTPVARDGYRGTGLMRKPPGTGPFPAVILIHGGLSTLPTETLKKYTLSAPASSVFLAAGYVVAVITYRGREADPQSTVSLEDSLAAVEHVARLRFVDSQSVVVYGCSGGGDLALEIAAARAPVRAVVAEEPASIIFTGILNARFPKAGTQLGPDDIRPIGENPKRFYTEEYRKLTRGKIGRINSPLLILQGDQDPVIVPFNNQVLIPELRHARKNVDVKTYAGEPHCFAFLGGAANTANVFKALEDADLFFRRHIKTQPQPVHSSLLTRVPFAVPRLNETTPAQEQRDQPVTEEDVRILRGAAELLKDESVWNRADDRECTDDEATGKRSLFCALQRACIDVLGTYDHRRVALQEVRFAVEDATRGQQFEHRLRDFNNLPNTRLADIKKVLEVAMERVKSRLKAK